MPSGSEGLELLFPFDPRVAATTLLPSAWDAQGSLSLPAVVSAPENLLYNFTAFDSQFLRFHGRERARPGHCPQSKSLLAG
jgi:hypothetical protein